MSRRPPKDKRAPGLGASTGRSLGALPRRQRSRAGCSGWRTTRSTRARRCVRWLGIAFLLAVLLPLGGGGVGAEPADGGHRARREDPESAAQSRLAARSRSLSPEARRAAREVYRAQLRLRAEVQDPRRDALLVEIRRAKEMVPSALGSGGGRPPGLPPKLEAQKARIESLLEELRTAYNGQRERLAELDRVQAGLRRMFDECESIRGLPQGPARDATRKRFLEELHLPQAARGPRRPEPMMSGPARRPPEEGGEPALGQPTHPQRRGTKP